MRTTSGRFNVKDVLDGEKAAAKPFESGRIFCKKITHKITHFYNQDGFLLSCRKKTEPCKTA